MKKEVTKVLFVLSALMLSFSMMSFATDEKKAVYVENEVHDFGTIAQDSDKVNATFILHNDSGNPISLISVRATCGCTAPQWSKEPIVSGNTTEIVVSFNPKGQSGTVNKRITAKTDTGETIVMHIKGIVER